MFRSKNKKYNIASLSNGADIESNPTKTAIDYFQEFKKQISRDMEYLEENIKSLKLQYRMYFDDLVGGHSNAVIDKNISILLNDIYKKGNEMKVSFQQANPQVLFMNSDVSNDDRESYQSLYDKIYAIFKQVWLELYEEKTKHQLKKISISKNYIQVMYPQATTAEVDDAASLMIENTNILSKSVLHKQLQLTDILMYAKQQHKDIVKLEMSLNEVNQLFIDMAILTENQGCTIDKIRENVQSAKDMISDSVSLLSDTKDSLQKRSVFHK